MNTTPHGERRLELPPDDQQPVFDKPWQAQAFSLLVHLHERGLFAWETWVKVFSAQIAAAPQRDDENTNDAYYRQWNAALERMTAQLGLTRPDELAARTEAWRQAYLNTPHGQPVELDNAQRPPCSSAAHIHKVSRTPITVSQARGG